MEAEGAEEAEEAEERRGLMGAWPPVREIPCEGSPYLRRLTARQWRGAPYPPKHPLYWRPPPPPPRW